MMVKGVAISIHEAAEILREGLTKKLGASAPIDHLAVMSYGKVLLTVDFDASATPNAPHRWEQLLAVTHYTRTDQ